MSYHEKKQWFRDSNVISGSNVDTVVFSLRFPGISLADLAMPLRDCTRSVQRHCECSRGLAQRSQPLPGNHELACFGCLVCCFITSAQLVN